jgi:regulator of nucleoside diphosphate kinase
MLSTTTIVNRLDRERLLPHLGGGEFAPPQALHLRQVLQRSRAVAPERVPGHVVTMNSRVRVRDVQREEDEVITLVYPDDLGVTPEAVSVLSPIGAALFGSQEGDPVRLVGARSSRSLVLARIEFQPEREGQFSL